MNWNLTDINLNQLSHVSIENLNFVKILYLVDIVDQLNEFFEEIGKIERIQGER